MAAWQTPKTNWVASDYFNIEDWGRIIGNIEYIKSICMELYPDFSIERTSGKGYADFVYAREFNDIENNIQKININTFPLELENAKSWKPNSLAPSYADFNRWETAILRLKTSLEAQLNALPRLSFTLGQGGIQI